MNNLARLPHVRDELNSGSSTANDSDILRAISRASEFARSYTRRIFHTETATAYLNGNGCTELWLGRAAVEPNRHDLFAATSIKVDNDQDGTYELTLAEGTDYWLYPDASGLAANRLDLIVDRQTGPQIYRWPKYRRSVQVIGRWGMTETTEAIIISGAQITGTLSDASDLSLVVSAAIANDEIAAGDVLFMGAEQTEVLSVNGTTVTLRTRGLNGTTAAEQASVPVYLRTFPEDLSRAVAKDAARYLWKAAQGYPSERPGGEWPMIRDAFDAYRMPEVA